MSILGLFLVILGSAIIITRAPLIVAPQQTRNLILRLIGTKDHMRFFGIFVAALGSVLVWIGASEPGVVAQIIFSLGFFMLLVAAFGMIPFPGPCEKLARRVWEKFSLRTLRIMGAAAVLFGALLILYGSGL